MSEKSTKIIWTKTDEAPALASYALYPILKNFTKNTGIEFDIKDISLAGRIIANFPDRLKDEQKQTDDLGFLGKLVKEKNANIIKLPNISASIAQLKAAIIELQSKGYDIPDYPENPVSEQEKQIQIRYSKVLGSAVNPVLREGNSDRRAAVSVKEYAKKNPHKMIKKWDENSKAHVSYMKDGDFYGSEKSVVIEKENIGNSKIEFFGENGATIVLKENINLIENEVIDASVMNIKKLRKFYENQIKEAKQQNLLLSLHLKATMMKVSDPIIFGHAVSVFYKDVFEKYSEIFEKLGVDPKNALVDVYTKIKQLPISEQKEIEKDILEIYKKQPELAMVDSDKGITNLHATNNIIIDASMPVVIRDGGKMWGADGKLHDTKAIIPDRCYATIYQKVIEDCQKNGAFNPATMGSVSNVGLMAQKAEEYGSHDKTFVSPNNGIIKIISENGKVLLEQKVDEGDIFRMCQVKDVPIRNWVELAVNRSKKTNTPAVFWLDKKRAHDEQLIKKVECFLEEIDTEDLDIYIKSPDEAMEYTLKRVRQGKDTISVTGNVLRDYLTDLFPILELGTSAKMLSIVPLLNGGGLFETGAGGSAPKHVQQFLKEGHLRWDSLGEYCALTASFEHIASNFNNKKAGLFGKTLDKAVSLFLENEKSPSRKVNELDNRGSSFYLSLYWAKELYEQDENLELKSKFEKIFRLMEANETKIVEEFNSAQGMAIDIGGYYLPDSFKLSQAMRPSKILNEIIDNI